MDQLAIKRRKIIAQDAGVVATMCAYTLFVYRRAGRTPPVTYGPLAERDKIRMANHRFIFHNDDRHCVEQLRMRRAPFFHLCTLLRTRRLLTDTINSSIEEQVAMFLQVVGHNCRFRLIELNFRRGLETISRYFHEILYAIGELRGEMIRPPSLEVHPKIANNQRFNPYFKACIFMTKEAQYLSWPNLLPEILGLVLRRLPSLADRVRLRAVCRPWRSNAQLDPLPPLLPWLTLLDGTFLSIPDGKIIRMPIPDKAFCSGSVDNWMFFMHSDGGCSLMNPFSKATVNISKLVITWFNSNSRYYNSHFFKLVAPSPLESSPGSLVALILEGGRRIRICQPPIAVDLELHPCFSWPHGQPQLSLLDDITFFNGKLYGLSRNVLSIFEINYGLDGKPKISCDLCITSHPTTILVPPRPLPGLYIVLSYLVECCGRLLMVNRKIGCNPDIEPCLLEADDTAGFEVFEADLSTKPGQWRCVSELGGQALFVGKHCSKSFPAGECTGVEEDCIYFICDYFPANLAADPLSDSGVYNMKSGNIKPLLSETAAVPQHHGGQWCPTWIFPADAM